MTKGINTKSSVLVVGNTRSVQNLFLRRGFDVIQENNFTRTPDLVCFTGGEDIDPRWYGEAKHFRTKFVAHNRDKKEHGLFQKYKDTPKVGICRGGQFLNVLSGGKLFQHVSGHTNTSNSHEMIDLLFTKGKITVPSGHHQMMIPADKGAYILGVAQEAKEHISLSGVKPPKYDPEVVWYPKTYSLCYQSHPEWELKGKNEHQDYFFDLINWAYSLP